MSDPEVRAQVFILKGDILSMDVDAIVCSSNNDLILGAGISGALRRMAGPGVQEECHAIGTIPLGEVAATAAGNLRTGVILHAAVNPLGFWADAKSVRAAARQSLEIAAARKFRSIAFPPLGCDAGGFSTERCATILSEEINSFVKQETSVEEIYLVFYDDKTYQVFEEKMKEMIPHLRTDAPGSGARAPSATAGPVNPEGESARL